DVASDGRAGKEVPDRWRVPGPQPEVMACRLALVAEVVGEEGVGASHSGAVRRPLAATLEPSRRSGGLEQHPDEVATVAGLVERLDLRRVRLRFGADAAETLLALRIVERVDVPANGVAGETLDGGIERVRT